ncbi:MAG: CotH kinase family protein, partial [Kiritimatiellae bacterium]|nr:CotH kinase family protein [Kiritimatiellia bacterium]
MGRYFLILLCGLCAYTVQAWSVVKLNEHVVKDSSGKPVVSGTEGSWNNRGDTKEKVFDGDTSTFFDPPSSANAVGNSWAGISFTNACWITKICYTGRKSQASRMKGLLFQGANQADFSDAVTIHVADPPSGWDGTTWVEVTLPQDTPAYYRYVRALGPGLGLGGDSCGNISEAEFYGFIGGLDTAPDAPLLYRSWFMNQTAGYQLKDQGNSPQVFEIQRMTEDEDQFVTVSRFAPEKSGETLKFLDALSSSAEYRVRAINPAGTSEWTSWSVTGRVEAVGTWIGTAGAYNNGDKVGSNVFDGDITTYFDAPSQSGWTGLDLGREQVVVGVRYFPRTSYPSRMRGGSFQAANDPDFTNPVTLYTISSSPSTTEITEVMFDTPALYYRYVRYVATSGHVNVGEVAFLLPDTDLEGPAAPSSSTAPGFYSGPVQVALSYGLADAQIFYTLDGSTPVGRETANCFKYTSPLILTNCCALTNYYCNIRTTPPEMDSHTQYGWVKPSTDQPNVNILRARAFKGGFASTNEFIGTWLIGPIPNSHTLRVVSLMTDEANFFSDATGIMVPGDIYNTLGWNGHSVGKPNANYFQSGSEWERPVMFELFETNRQEVVAQRLGVRTHGGWSRAAAEKTLRFYSRKAYGKKKVSYPIFPGRDQKSYKRFLLRNSGNDWSASGFRDAVGQQLFWKYAKTSLQDYEPAVIYVNGEYWGIENFRDDYSNRYFEERYGADPDNLDFIKFDASNGMKLEEGDTQSYEALLQFAKSNDFTRDQVYEEMSRKVDLDDMIDAYFCNMFLGNTDWLGNGNGNNFGLWRERVDYTNGVTGVHDGRWRCAVYDTDTGLGLNSSVTTDTLGAAKNNPVFKALVNNQNFVWKYTNRAMDLLNTALLPTRTTNILYTAASRVSSEIPRHIDRWTRMQSYSKWNSQVSTIRDFLLQRPDRFRSQLASWFELGETYEVTLTTNGCGRIRINSLVSGDKEPEFTLPWTGIYFKSVPITLSTTPAAGYAFAYWMINDEVVPDPVVTRAFPGNTSICAVFVPSPLPRIVVNEVMADADTPDWFELYNEEPRPVDLSGFWLVDDNPDNACEIPAGTEIPAGGFLLVWAAGDNVTVMNPDGTLHVGFALGKKSDAVTLLSPDQTTAVSTIAFTKQTFNVSSGCWENGDLSGWSIQSIPTPGLPNRSPLATGELLPDSVTTQVFAGATVTLDFPVRGTVDSGGHYELADSVAPDAQIDGQGRFTWTTSADGEGGVYPFRIVWTGTVDGVDAADETTLLVTISQSVSVTGTASPSWGGTVTGGGDYAEGSLVTLVAEPAENWIFAGWSDGFSFANRMVRLTASTNYVALFALHVAAPSLTSSTLYGGKPLIYWSPVAGADRYRVYRKTETGTAFVSLAETTESCFLDSSRSANAKCAYRVTALIKNYESVPGSDTQAYASGVAHEFTGTIIGTLGSWSNAGDVREHVFDNNTSTYFDPPSDTTAWAGLDLGEAFRRTITEIWFYPRKDWASRMKGGVFQVSLQSNGTTTFEDPITLYTIDSTPASSQYTKVTLNATYTW